MKNRNKKQNTFQIISFVILVILIFSILFEIYSLKSNLNETEIIIKHTYLINGKEHDTIYYKNNHSYIIDKPFTCDNKTYYSIYEDYLINCEVSPK